MPKLARNALLGLVLLALAGCGSTRSLDSLGGRGGASNGAIGAGDSFLAPGGDSDVQAAPSESSSSSASPGASGSADTDVASSDAGEDAGADTTDYSSYGSGAGSGGSGAVKANGPIEIGIPYIDSASGNAVLGSIGAGLASNDSKQLYEIYIDDLNKKGGILGRKVKGIYLKLNVNDDTATLAQTICTYFTQDHKVGWVFITDIGNAVYPCLNSKGVATISAGNSDTSRTILKQTNLAQLPDTIGMDRLFSMLVDQYVAMGYFGTKPTDKLGVLHYDHRSVMDGVAALKAGLAKHNLKISDSYSIKQYTSVAEIAGMEAAVKSAELRFRAENITHVICVESNAFLCGFFAIYAAQQGYYPRYAFSSAQPLTNVISNVPPRALERSVFVGWRPAQDVQSESEMPASMRSCVTFFRKNGVEISTGNAYDQAAGICDDLGFFAAALKAGPSVTVPGFMQGASKLAGRFSPVNSFGIAPGLHRDAASVVRRGSYVPACDCFRYSGGPINIG